MTVLSDYVSRMVEGGMEQAEAMQIAAELFAAGAAASCIRPSSGALRTRKWRHKASQSVTERHANETSPTVTRRHKASHCDVSTVSPIDTKIIKVSRQNSDRPSRGTRIDPDWSPTSDDRFLAKQEGFSEAEIDREALRFRDYWKSRAGAGGVKLDWSATWRNWVRTSAEKLGKTPVSSAPPSPSSGFYATADSEQLAAWDAWSIRKRKKSMPRDKNFGWRVDTEWPPGYVREKPNVDLPAPIPILRSMQ